MWSDYNASRLDVDMDGMRTCPSYETGFDACDPLGNLGSVAEWSGRRPARVLRRRCRSEGVERSPYEDATRESYRAEDYRCALPNKTHFTLNSGLELRHDRFNHECALPHAENGDYVMAHENNAHYG